jgi:predicted transcriptional regulator
MDKISISKITPGQFIRIREELSLSQYGIANLTGMSRWRIHLYESGQIDGFSDEEKDAIKSAFIAVRKEIINNLNDLF